MTQHRMIERSAERREALKGVKGGNCNVRMCQRPGADYYNKSTRKYYCADCAEEINWPGGREDTMRLYGVPLLCEKDTDDSPQDNPEWEFLKLLSEHGIAANYMGDGVYVGPAKRLKEFFDKGLDLGYQRGLKGRA